MGGRELECTQGVGNGLDDTFYVLIDLGQPKPQHAKADLAQPVISPRLVDELIALVVAVDFDHQHFVPACEVGEVGADRNLASKLVSPQLPATQAVPEPPFGPGHLSPQLLGGLIPSSPLGTGLTSMDESSQQRPAAASQALNALLPTSPRAAGGGRMTSSASQDLGDWTVWARILRWPEPREGDGSCVADVPEQELLKGSGR